MIWIRNYVYAIVVAIYGYVEKDVFSTHLLYRVRSQGFG